MKVQNDDDILHFADDPFFSGDEQTPTESDKWNILIVDDEMDIHQVTKLVFRDFEFENKPLHFYSAFSSEEAKRIIKENPDIALILLDVVMEEEHAGLKFVKYLRDEENNKLARIIIRTGQPGQAPEKNVIVDYDINDYKEKTELTQDKLYTALIAALRSYRDLQEIARSKNEIQLIMQAADRFVPHSFLHFLNKKNITQVHLGDHVEQEMTILFMDIRSFTIASEQLTPIENFHFINSLFSYLEPPVIKQGGFIDKYIGDSVMALFFGPPAQAIQAALEMLKVLKICNKERKQINKHSVKIGISVNSGLVALGTIGFHDRMDCTVVSDVVNTASKLEKMNKVFGTRLLITEATYKKLDEKFQIFSRNLGKTKIPGKGKIITIYEVFEADEKKVKKFKLESKEEFHQAVKLYNESHFEKAKIIFDKIIEMNPSDTVVNFFLNHCSNK